MLVGRVADNEWAVVDLTSWIRGLKLSILRMLAVDKLAKSSPRFADELHMV